jgi:AcrR family transcriptional regulator
MSELRKKQREKREQAIIEVTKKLVGEKGYRETSIEEIAAAAEVGPATVYNYFGSKAGLLLSALGREADLLLAAGDTVLRDPPEAAEDAVFALVETYFGVLVRHFSKRLMRELMVVFMLEQTNVREQLMGLDYLVVGQIVKLLAICKSRGQLRADVAADEAAMTIYSLVVAASIAHMVEDGMTLKNFLVLVRRQLGLLFQGIGAHPVRGTN